MIEKFDVNDFARKELSGGLIWDAETLRIIEKINELIESLNNLTKDK